METLLEIIKYTLPSIIVLFAVWIMIHYFTKNLQKDKHHQIKLASSKKTLPLQLQAYERLAVYLERITLDTLLVKEINSAQSARDMHNKLIETIRSEFDHNMSQQIYLSDEAWKVIRLAKENTIKMINAAFQQTNPDANSLDLSKKILDIQIEAGNSPAQAALSFIKADVRKLF
ncbi:MAG: hypothetical protein J7L96_01875 [Bacteroidales bacterium]|nr:hypothetical protein [Bacteroidales bacterium]